MKINIYAITLLTFISPSTFTMEQQVATIKQQVATIERMLVAGAHKRPVDTILDEVKEFLGDPTLSFASTEVVKAKLIPVLCQYRANSSTTVIDSNRRSTTSYNFNEYVDGTTSAYEIETIGNLDLTETRIVKERAISPWYCLSLESIIKLFLQNYNK